MLSNITDTIEKFVVTFPAGMGDVNSYLIKGKNGYTVIDTGINHREAIENWQKFLDSGAVIEKVVLTHTHEDHLGLARWFQETHGIPIVVSKLGYEQMEIRKQLTYEKMNHLITKYGGPKIPKNFKDDKTIYDFVPDEFFEKNQMIQLGDELFEAIWTPGHAYDHFCFYNKEQKVMIVGDHILKDISPVIGLWNGEEQNPLVEYFQSLELIKEYQSDIALPGHGDVIEEFEERVSEISRNHQHRLEQVVDIIKTDYKNASEICHEIYGTLNVIIQLSSFMATVTRLLYLESLGKVERKEVDGVNTFRALSST
ncbi:MBL fold metallo-hydrolase [Oceanobacillus bengalensis]|uniref:MBL fold metallo-hydrolase n=1 Tax=Oceanobacillus bengalensis TaxID=1435466 RepID=A0A494Z7X2_9BACI|nr:MBL fold metallo-hydrolase [Oceanobacillus bengalensis]RKQ18711.1 MBL fold metallo-hydrolase [Oceanobacillus bengalensis]